MAKIKRTNISYVKKSYAKISWSTVYANIQITKILMIKEDYPCMHNKLKCTVERNTLHAQIGYRSCINYILFMSPQLPSSRQPWTKIFMSMVYWSTSGKLCHKDIKHKTYNKLTFHIVQGATGPIWSWNAAASVKCIHRPSYIIYWDREFLVSLLHFKVGPEWNFEIWHFEAIIHNFKTVYSVETKLTTFTIQLVLLVHSKAHAYSLLPVSVY